MARAHDSDPGSGFVSLRLAGVVSEPDRHPKLRDFVQRMHTRPSFAGVIAPVVDLVGRRGVALDRERAGALDDDAGILTIKRRT